MKPTVTQLIDLLNKPALLKWANKIGLEGVHIDDYRNKSKKEGISFHKQIELFIKDAIPFESNEMQINFERYFINKKIISFEKNIETEYFRGRYDILIEHKSNKYICDFKSNQKVCYFENKLQLVAYKMAEPCSNVGIISIPDFKYIPTNISDFNKYEEIIISLSLIYKIKNQIENGN